MRLSELGPRSAAARSRLPRTAAEPDPRARPPRARDRREARSTGGGACRSPTRSAAGIPGRRTADRDDEEVGLDGLRVEHLRAALRAEVEDVLLPVRLLRDPHEVVVATGDPHLVRPERRPASRMRCPVRRWQSRQWQIETTNGSPSHLRARAGHSGTRLPAGRHERASVLDEFPPPAGRGPRRRERTFRRRARVSRMSAPAWTAYDEALPPAYQWAGRSPAGRRCRRRPRRSQLGPGEVAHARFAPGLGRRLLRRERSTAGLSS